MDNLDNSPILKRKFRHSLQGSFPSGEIEEMFLHRYTSHEAIGPRFTTFHYQLNDAKGLWEVLAKMYEIGTFNSDFGEAEKEFGTVKITCYEGNGTKVSQWEYKKVYPTSISFGDFDEEMEITWAFKEVKYEKEKI